jgi:hypothetical protein
LFVQINDVSGRVLYRRELSGQIDFSTFESGIYYLTVFKMNLQVRLFKSLNKTAIDFLIGTFLLNEKIKSYETNVFKCFNFLSLYTKCSVIKKSSNGEYQ